MVCSICDKNRNELHARPSRLLKTMTLHICNECISAKLEPRYLVILMGRKNGPEYVADYIKNHRYIGKDILAKELMT